MRKTLLCAAALAAGLASSVAQNVYSLNVVGYYNVTVPAGTYKMIANQLVQTNSSVASIFAVPGGTSLLKWTGTTFAVNNFDADFGWDDAAATLVPGEGAFIKAPAGTNLTLTFVGEVNQQTNALAFTADVYKMVSLFTPQGGKVTTDFGFPAAAGDLVQQWNGTTYVSLGYDADFGWDPEPQVAVGEGFFVKTKTTKTWTRSFKVQ